MLRHALGTQAPRAVHRILGVDLAVHDSDPGSSKPALVCLHAIGHGGGDFAGVESAQGASWRIVTVDWPGQGNSGEDAVPASARRYAELLAALASLGPGAIARIPHAKVVFFEAGHSAFLETPEAFNAELSAFLSGVSSGGGEADHGAAISS